MVLSIHLRLGHDEDIVEQEFAERRYMVAFPVVYARR